MTLKILGVAFFSIACTPSGLRDAARLAAIQTDSRPSPDANQKVGAEGVEPPLPNASRGARLEVTVVPGKGINAVNLGMTEAQLRQAGATPKPGRTTDERALGDGLWIRLKNGSVDQVRLEMPAAGVPIHLGAIRLHPKLPSDIAAHVAGCGPLHWYGEIECRSGLSIHQSDGRFSVTVRAPDNGGLYVCDVYADGRDPKTRVRIDVGKTYCLPSAVVYAHLPPEGVGVMHFHKCRTQEHSDRTIVTCPGTEYLFMGPKRRLVEVYGIRAPQ